MNRTIFSGIICLPGEKFLVKTYIDFDNKNQTVANAKQLYFYK